MGQSIRGARRIACLLHFSRENVTVSLDHRKPVVAFVVLALVVTGLIGMQRADAQGGRLLAAMVGAAAGVHGVLPAPARDSEEAAVSRVVALGPAFAALTGGADQVTILDDPAASGVKAGAKAHGKLLAKALAKAHGEPVGKTHGKRLAKTPGKLHPKAGRSSGGAIRRDGHGKAAGKPDTRPERTSVTYSDTEKPGAKPTPGSGTSTRPRIIVKPSRAQSQQRRAEQRSFGR
jgi:hypothetical protein